MKTHPHFNGVAAVTRAMVYARAQELAVFACHAPPHFTAVDYLQARRELTGESDLERQDAILDANPGTDPLDQMRGAEGRRALRNSTEDEGGAKPRGQAKGVRPLEVKSAPDM